MMFDHSRENSKLDERVQPFRVHVADHVLPGYGFSDARAVTGATFQIGDLWHRLMTEHLGYEHFAAHGGDWGSLVTEILARDHADSVVGIHLTDVPFYHSFQKPHDPSHKEKAYLAQIEKFTQKEGVYALIQGSQPQLLANAIIYWVSQTINSSFAPYYDVAHAPEALVKDIREFFRTLRSTRLAGSLGKTAAG